MSQKRIVIRVVILCLLLVGWGVVQSQMKPSPKTSQTSSATTPLVQSELTTAPNPFDETHIQLTEVTKDVTKEATLPQLLPPLQKANPIEDETLLKQQRKTIDQELPHATEEEKKIWLETFKDLPPEAIRETLRARKLLGPLMEPLKVAIPELPMIEEEHQSSQTPSPSPSPSPSHVISSGSNQTLQTAIVAMEQAEHVAMNNIANALTFGFKRTKTCLSDLPYQRVGISVPVVQQSNVAIELEIGFGVQVEKTEIDMSQGKLKKTGRQLDIAIQGDGFFQVAGDNGEIIYTRNGQLSTNQDGELIYQVAGKAFRIEPVVTIPKNTTSIHISSQGVVNVQQPDTTDRTNFGQLQIAKFPVPSQLKQLGGGLYAATEAAGKLEIASPGSEGFGILQQGSLECSNVNMEEEIATLKQYRKQLQTLLELQR